METPRKISWWWPVSLRSPEVVAMILLRLTCHDLWYNAAGPRSTSRRKSSVCLYTWFKMIFNVGCLDEKLKPQETRCNSYSCRCELISNWLLALVLRTPAWLLSSRVNPLHQIVHLLHCSQPARHHHPPTSTQCKSIWNSRNFNSVC